MLSKNSRRTNGSSPDVAISTVSGAIVINSIAATENGKFERAKIESVTGAIHFNGDIERGASVTFDTHSGPTEIAIPRKTGADFDIASITGTISNDLNYSTPVKGRYGRGSELIMTNSAGGARITIRSFKGPVNLRIAK